MKIVLVSFFALMSIHSLSAIADETGTCSYQGHTVANGVLLNVCTNSGESFEHVTLLDCISNANQFFVTPQECTVEITNPFKGTKTEQTYYVHHKRLKYTFVGDESHLKVSGVIKR